LICLGWHTRMAVRLSTVYAWWKNTRLFFRAEKMREGGHSWTHERKFWNVRIFAPLFWRQNELYLYHACQHIFSEIKLCSHEFICLVETLGDKLNWGGLFNDAIPTVRNVIAGRHFHSPRRKASLVLNTRLWEIEHVFSSQWGGWMEKKMQSTLSIF
jgi:hypothetical protein